MADEYSKEYHQEESENYLKAAEEENGRTERSAKLTEE
jgi:hypothetical protein